MLAVFSPHKIEISPWSFPQGFAAGAAPHSLQSALLDSFEKTKSGPARSSVNKLLANLDGCPSRNLTASLAAMAPIVAATLLVTPRLSQLSLGLETNEGKIHSRHAVLGGWKRAAWPWFAIALVKRYGTRVLIE